MPTNKPGYDKAYYSKNFNRISELRRKTYDPKKTREFYLRKNKAKKIIDASKATAKRDGHLAINISEKDLLRWLEIQPSICRICNKQGKKLVADHCHKTGRLRGLLCVKCNVGLGYIETPNFIALSLEYLGIG